jgi:hypothetical protein
MTRTQSNFMSAIDNLFIDKSKLETYMLSSLSNGLADHEAQLLEIHYINLELN